MSQSAKILLKFDPEFDLHFKGPYVKPVMQSLKLTSISDKIVAFKVKTTAPKFYTVNPTHGFIRPNDEETINLTFNGYTDHSYSNIKHKFLVQATIHPEETPSLTPERFWKEIKKDATIYEYKFRCLFDDEPVVQVESSNQQFTSILNKEDATKISTSTINENNQQKGFCRFSLKTTIYMVFAAIVTAFTIPFYRILVGKKQNSGQQPSTQAPVSNNLTTTNMDNQQPGQESSRCSITTIIYIVCAALVAAVAIIYWNIVGIVGKK